MNNIIFLYIKIYNIINIYFFLLYLNKLMENISNHMDKYCI